MHKLNLKESLALGILQGGSGLFMDHWPYTWAKKKLQPVVDQIMEEAGQQAINEIHRQEARSGQRWRITVSVELKGNEIHSNSIFETGLSFEGIARSACDCMRPFPAKRFKYIVS